MTDLALSKLLPAATAAKLSIGIADLTLSKLLLAVKAPKLSMR